MVKNGKITGIIDWEFAGWYPEYWNYTKVHYGHRPIRQDFYDVFDKTATTYPTELTAERAIWTSYTTFHYDCPRDYPIVQKVEDVPEGSAA